MKLCVAPVSSRTVMRRGPWAVLSTPDRRGLNSGFARCQVRNSGRVVRGARQAWRAAAKSSESR